MGKIDYTQASTNKAIKILCENIDKKIEAKKFDAALKIADQAVKRYCQDARVWYWKGKVFYYQERLEEALGAFEKSNKFALGYGFGPEGEDGEELEAEMKQKIIADEERYKALADKAAGGNTDTANGTKTS